MKKFKSLIITLITLVAITSFIGCTKKEKQVVTNNLKVEYKATVEIDEVICNLGGQEIKLTPMHNDKKIKQGYSNTTQLPKEKDIKISVKIINDNKTIYENNNLKVNLSNEKTGVISISGNELDNLKVNIINK